MNYKILLLSILIHLNYFSQQEDSLLKLYTQFNNTEDKVDQGNQWVKEISYANPDKAIILAKKNIALAKQLNYEYGYANALGCKGWAYDFKGILDSAVFYYTAAAKKHEELGNTKEYANNLNNLGVVYYLNGNYPNSILFYNKTLTIRQSLHDSLGASKTYNNIGLINYKLKNYTQAIACYKKSYSIKSIIGDSTGMVNPLVNISNSYLFLGDYEKALNYSNLTLKIATLLNDQFTLATLKIDRALIYKNQGNIALAITENKKAIAEISTLSQKNYNYLEEAYHNLSVVLHENKQYEESIDAGMKALEIALHLGKRETEQKIYYGLSDTYFKLNNWEEAYQYLRKGKELEEVLFDDKTSNSFAELSVKYKMDSIKNHEITQIKIEQQRADASDILREEEKRKNFYFLVLIIVFALSLFFVIISFVNNLKTKKVLLQKNEIIEKSLDEKEVLMREIHHRVKNNIQSIKSMISIQKRNSNSQEVIHSLNETLNRISAMSLIHDKLYKQDDITSIDSSAYLKELCYEVFKSFGFSENENLDFIFEFNRVNFPLDDLLIFGLIINEIITNSCKYGIGEDNKLSVSVIGAIQENELYVQIKDKGNGRVKNTPSFGTGLIDALIFKLKGKINYLANDGFIIEILIPWDGKL